MYENFGSPSGDTNLYGYVMNDPVNFVDPEGTNGYLVGAAVVGLFASHFVRQGIKAYISSKKFTQRKLNEKLSEQMREYDPSENGGQCPIGRDPLWYNHNPSRTHIGEGVPFVPAI